jgi:hypothetical protein
MNNPTLATNIKSEYEKPLTWNDIAQIAFDLNIIKEDQTKALFGEFKEADYDRGDKILINTEFFKAAKIPEIAKDRIIPSQHISYLKYLVIRGDKKPDGKIKIESDFGLVLKDSNSLINFNPQA